ncbi:hypothetical protein cand_012690 [Cryptosporidium andersoni]|uniref:Uncharacterized protein n=1 Tax=Cryptosporidium andersoni TaxID=117008 RepID=A0A1J4MEA2_9CRYT|nr:hypothetical protein cand_012690 [Cryptosporidium andersoni]
MEDERLDKRIVRRKCGLRNLNRFDIFVTRKKPLIVYYRRALDLLLLSVNANAIYKNRIGYRRNKNKLDISNEIPKVVIHGMGACINTAIWLVQDLKTNFGDSIKETIETKTVEVIDDYITEDFEWDMTSKKRGVSAISITIERYLN